MFLYMERDKYTLRDTLKCTYVHKQLFQMHKMWGVYANVLLGTPKNVYQDF